MNCLPALLLLVAAAYTIARPNDLSVRMGLAMRRKRADNVLNLPTHHLFPSGYMLPRILIPNYLRYENNPVAPVLPPSNDWLTKEIALISKMEDDDSAVHNYDSYMSPWFDRDRYQHRVYIESPLKEEPYSPTYDSHLVRHIRPMEPLPISAPDTSQPIDNPWEERAVDKNNYNSPAIQLEPVTPILHNEITQGPPERLLKPTQRRAFALTPLDKGYFDEKVKEKISTVTETESEVAIDVPPRQTRQNPNLSKTKTLVAENLDRLRTGLANKEYRIPVSLLPVNLDLLKINKLDDHNDERSHDDSTDRPRHIHVLETSNMEASQYIYEVAIIAAAGAALAMAIVGFAFGWYTLSKKAKAAADVDYPAYGVTGPTLESSGDRKLAHSAHMYHYQHQKQQILAMERNGMERTGSVSDPESEEENEEGDYTVYECPGFATTGEMEVKNPLFCDEPTPATPANPAAPATSGRYEIVKPQPKE